MHFLLQVLWLAAWAGPVGAEEQELFPWAQPPPLERPPAKQAAPRQPPRRPPAWPPRRQGGGERAAGPTRKLTASRRYVPAHAPPECRDTAGYFDLGLNTCDDHRVNRWCTTTSGDSGGPGWIRRRRAYYTSYKRCISIGWSTRCTRLRAEPFNSCCHCGGCPSCTGCVAPVPIFLQSEVDRLASFNCSRIDGELWLRSRDALDLSPLWNLTYVQMLYIDDIYREAGLTSFHGFQNLESTGGILSISDVPDLRSFVGFHGLRSVGGDLVIADLAVASLRGFGNLTTITGSLMLKNLANLASFEGLESLTRIGGSIMIEGTPGITSFRGFRDLVEVGGDVVLNMPNLSSWEGLEGLRSIGGSFRVTSTALPLIASFEGLGGLESVQGDFEVAGLAALTSARGLDSLSSVGGRLLFSQLPRLVSLDDAGNLTDVGGDLVLEDLPSLASTLLPNLASVGGHFQLTNLNALKSFGAIDALSSVGGAFVLQNVHVETFAGLSGLTTLGTDGAGISLSISSCQNLRSTRGLSNLTGAVPGSVLLSSLPLLEDLADLDGVSSVGSDASGNGLVISGARRLRSIESLSGIREVRGRVEITLAPILQTLKGLDQMTQAGDLVINDVGVETLDGLRSLGTLSRLPAGTSSIHIENCPRLTSIAGLRRFAGALDGRLYLKSLPELTSLQGLEGITSVAAVQGTSLVVEEVHKIDDLTGLGGIQGIINGSVLIESNTQLQSLQGLEGVTYIRDFKVSTCPNLKTLAALSSLTALPLVTDLLSLPQLRSLHGLEGLARAPQNPWDCGCSGIPGSNAHCLVTDQSEFKIRGCDGLLSVAGLSNLVGLVNNLDLDAVNLKSLQGIKNFSAQNVIVSSWANNFCYMQTERSHIQATRDFYDNTWCNGARASDAAAFPSTALASTSQTCAECSPACGALPSGSLVECDYHTGGCLCPLGTRGPGCSEVLPKVYVVAGQEYGCPLDLLSVGDALLPRTHCNLSISLRRDPAPQGAAGPALLTVVAEEPDGLAAAGSAANGTHYSDLTVGSVRWLNSTHGELPVQIRMLRRSQYDDQRHALRLFVAYTSNSPDGLLDGTLLTGDFVTSSPKIWPWCTSPGGGCRATSPVVPEATLSMVGGKIRFLQSYQEVREDQELVVIVVQRVGGDAGQVSAYVDIDRQRSSASPGEDFSFTRARLLWEDGDMDIKAFPFKVHNDPVWEPTESIVLQITDMTHEDFRDSALQEMHINITDDGDGGLLQLEPAFAMVREDVRNISECLLYVTRNSGSSGRASARVILQPTTLLCGGGAAATRDGADVGYGEADFNFTQGTAWLEWADGDHSRKCIFGEGRSKLTIHSDWMSEPNEELCLTLSHVRGSASVSQQWGFSKVMLVDIGLGGQRGTYLRCNRGKCTCAPGWYTNDTSRPEDCRRCEAGYICEGGTTHTACPPGTSARQNSQRCEDCEAGFFQDTPGSSTCKICPEGAFANASGQSSCHTCSSVWGSEGFVRVGPIDPDPEDCVCPAGSYLPCPGRFCARGAYPPSGGCQTCPKGFVCGGSFEAQAGVDAYSGPQVAAPSQRRLSAGGAELDPSGGGDFLGAPSGVAEAPRLLLSAGGALVHGQPRLREGYFATVADPYCAVKCLNGQQGFEKACPGVRPLGVCGGTGRVNGFACAECEPNHFQSGGECMPCSPSSSAFLPLALVALVCGLTALTISLNRKQRLQQRNGSVSMMSVASFVLFSMQFLGLFGTLPIHWNADMGAFVDFCSSAAKLNLEVLSPSCSFVQSDLGAYTTSLAFYPFVFTVCLTVLIVKHFVVQRTAEGGFKKFRIEAAHTLGAVGLTLFLSIISPIVQPFIIYAHPCPTIQSVADFPNVFVGSEAHSVFMALGIIGCLAIPLPFAAVCVWATWQYPVRYARRDTAFLHAFRFLFMKYKAQAYHFSLCLIVRNLVLSLAPVVMRGTVLGQFIVIAACLFLHTAVQMMSWPWRIEWVNYVEMGMNLGLEHFLFLGAMLTDLPIDLGEGVELPNFAGVCIVGGLSVILGIGLIWSISRVLYPNPMRSFFIVHSKQDSSARARLLKTMFEEQVSWPSAALCTSDAFEDVDRLIEIVRSQVKNVLVLLTQTTLSRPCLLAELVVSVQLNVPCIVVRCSDFVPPDNVKKDLPRVLTHGQSQLAGYEIRQEHMVEAVEAVLAMQYIEEGIRSGAEEMEAIVAAVLQRASRLILKPSSGPKVARGPPEGQEIVMITDINDPEAVSSSILLHRLLAPKLGEASIFLQAQSGSSPVKFKELCRYIHEEGAGCETVIFLVNGSFLSSPEGLGLILPSMQRFLGDHLNIVPVMLDGFQFPNKVFLEERLPSILEETARMGLSVPVQDGTRLYTQFLSLCSLKFHLEDAKSELQQQANEVLKLVQGSHEDMMKVVAKDSNFRSSMVNRAKQDGIVCLERDDDMLEEPRLSPRPDAQWTKHV